MNILITGANRGIGQELANRYRAQGHNVLATTRSDDEFLPLDVTDPASVQTLAETLKDQPINLLICNAGVYLDKGQSLDTGYSAELWAQTFAVNATGVFLTIQALLPNLRAAKGKIAIIASQMASSTLAPGGSYIYRASKAAALNIGRNMSVDLKPEGIAVGIYHPGWVITDMGGSGADISVEKSATGLCDRFADLSMDTTGCFLTWDGQEHPY